ncbi:MAG: hypothetical protein MI867_12555 [Pseudomonadales bacterium]|nr:hypothetical protein [Pseudomonadales bacterium]
MPIDESYIKRLAEKQAWIEVNGIRNDLIMRVNNYLQITGISATSLGWRAAQNNLLITKLLEEGKGMTVDTADSLLAYMHFSLTDVQREVYEKLNTEGKSINE